MLGWITLRAMLRPSVLEWNRQRSDYPHVPSNKHRVGDGTLAKTFRHEIEGDVLFDRFSRGRYSTDASIYQIEPIGVVVPRDEQDVVRIIQIAREEAIPVLPRGAGTSQGGQAVGEAVVVDTRRYLTGIIAVDPAEQTATVQPGVVLDNLNAVLRPHGLCFPVDIATASRATIGGMAGNNSAGARSIRYGLMVDNVRSIDALLSDGTTMHFGRTAAGSDKYSELVRIMRALYEREAEEIARRIPRVLRHVAGYNLHRMGLEAGNMADMLVGSEGTLAFFTKIVLDLQPIPRHRTLGVCHFPMLANAMEAVSRIVELDPTAVELMDDTLLKLASDNPVFRSSVARFVEGQPGALLLVEFCAEQQDEAVKQLDRLDELMGSLGFPKSVVRAVEPAFQEDIWSVRRAGLNVVMSMKDAKKPISFIEDCAVPLDKLAEYTARLCGLFDKHGTSGTWYAHASVGCLHVRPALNLKEQVDVSKMRAIAEEAHEIVREFKGSHSGEHGDGIVRSEFLTSMLGERLVRAFEEVKEAFDPDGLFNPGKIVNPPLMDDRTLFRYTPDYSSAPNEPALDWSEWHGMLGAVEMCNNNGACLRVTPGVMCPSFRATQNEQHVTRGRANVLRLALTNQLGPDAIVSDEMRDAMDLCVGCKACRRECPVGVDMARMKIEFLHQYRQQHGTKLRDRLVAYLPRYARWAARAPFMLNLRNRNRAVAALSERILGLTSQRDLPTLRSDFFRAKNGSTSSSPNEVVLLADTFNTYFEPDNLRSATTVLRAAGYSPIVPTPSDGGRPLCCGRTFLSAGMVDEARSEAERLTRTLQPYVAHGVAIVGLEPSCLLTLRDEFTVLIPGAATQELAARAVLLEEFLASDQPASRIQSRLGPLPTNRLLIHGHCHQKAFGTMSAMERVLGWIPGVEVETIESGCCGMAGAFGYESEHYDISMRMAELDLLPAIRESDPSGWLVTNGTSCRKQILDGCGREATHMVKVIEASLKHRSKT